MSVINHLGSLQVGLTGFQRNLEAFERTAERVSQNSPGSDLASDMVEMMTEVHGVKANAVVIRTADELVGTLIDTFA